MASLNLRALSGRYGSWPRTRCVRRFLEAGSQTAVSFRQTTDETPHLIAISLSHRQVELSCVSAVGFFEVVNCDVMSVAKSALGLKNAICTDLLHPAFGRPRFWGAVHDAGSAEQGFTRSVTKSLDFSRGSIDKNPI